jgi:hypothetical protein
MADFTFLYNPTAVRNFADFFRFAHLNPRQHQLSALRATRLFKARSVIEPLTCWEYGKTVD